MAKDYLEIGPVPCEEDCECLGPNYDPGKAMRECRLFIKAIRLVCGEEPMGAQLKVRHNSHDFGVYLEVAIVYDDTDEKAMEYAYKIESDAPTTWPESLRTEVDALTPAVTATA